MSIDKSRFENSVRYEVALEDGRTTEYWYTSASASNLSLGIPHVTGKNSLVFDKTVGSTVASIYRNPSVTGTLDLSMFALTGHINLWVYLPSTSAISNVDFFLGSDSSNYFNWSSPSSTLIVGWNELQFRCTDFTQVGNGIDWYNVEYMGLSVTFTSTTDILSGLALDSVTIQNPLHNFGVGGNISIENTGAGHRAYEKLADVTNGVDNTYYYYIDLDTYKYFSLQFILDGGSGTVTCTVEISAIDEVAVPADATYVDMTSAFFCTAGFTQSTYVIVDTPIPARYARVKVVVDTSGVNDADWKIYLVKTY